jgi:hypothetical protein
LNFYIFSGVDRQELLPPGKDRLPGTHISAALKASDTGIDDEEGLDPSTMPYFDYGVIRNVTTVVAQHAFILCRVHRMQDRSVSFYMASTLFLMAIL